VVQDIVHLGVVEDGHVDIGDRLGENGVGVFALDGSETDVCVLDEWSKVAFKGCAPLDVECIVVDTASQLTFSSSKDGRTVYQPYLEFLQR
jgi:hypothetical protein